MLTRILLIALSILAGSVSLPAIAQDRCGDVLANGTFQNSRYRENSYFQQIIWSRFLSSTFQESKTNRNLGFGVPVGEIVLNGDYNEETFRQKKADIRKELSNTLTSANEIDVALVSGDPVIANAWADCMKARGGYVSLRFEPVSATQAFAKLSWVAGPAGTQTGVASTTLDEDVTLPTGATFASGSSCFRSGRVLSSVSPCVATINLSNASQDLAISVNTPHGSAQAYLPPRLTLIRETKPYSFAPSDAFRASAFRQDKRESHKIDLSEELIQQGWRFDPSAATATIQVNQQGHWVHKCDDPKVRADSFSFFYDFHLFASGRNSPERNVSIVCTLRPEIKLTRDRWVPVGSAPS